MSQATADSRKTLIPLPRLGFRIELPDNIPSDAVWIRYLLSEPGNSGSAIAILKPEPSLRQYVINATFGGKPAQYTKIVVYARGCQFNTLPGKIVHGFLPPAQIPSSRITCAVEEPGETC